MFLPTFATNDSAFVPKEGFVPDEATANRDRGSGLETYLWYRASRYNAMSGSNDSGTGDN
jgi:hypothetical protein